MRLDRTDVLKLRLPEGKSEARYFDSEIPGWGVRVRSNDGGRTVRHTWVVQYREKASGRSVTHTIGDARKLSASKARAEAKKVAANVTLGGSPHDEKQTARAAAKETVGKWVEKYLASKEGKLRERSLVEVRRHLQGSEKDDGPRFWAVLHGKGVKEVMRADVADGLNRIEKASGAVAVNRARSNLSAFFAWLIEEGVADANPVVGTRKVEEEARERVMADAELAAIWKACDADDDDYSRIVRLLMLTGQRRAEVAGIEEGELNLDEALWVIPAARAKNGREHEVPLSDRAVEILRGVDRDEDRSLLFGEGEGAFSGWSKAKAALDERIKEATKKAPKPWTLHDLRRTVATMMAEKLGVQPHVIEAVLNHVSGHKAGVAGIYNRATYAKEKREALTLWADYLLALVGEKSNVVPMKRA